MVPRHSRPTAASTSGISNPGPWGGSPVRPNGGMYPGPRAVHGLVARAHRRHRAAALVRPGDQARRPRLRPRGLADRRRRRPSTAPGNRDASSPGTASRGKRRWSRPWGRTCTTSARFRGRRRSSARALGRCAHADGLRRRPALRPGRRALHARVVGRPRVPGRSAQGRRRALRALGAAAAGSSGSGGSARRPPAARPSRATSSSRRASTAASSPSPRTDGAPALADEGARRHQRLPAASQATCCSSAPARRARDRRARPS